VSGSPPRVAWSALLGSAVGGVLLEWVVLTGYFLAAFDSGITTTGLVLAALAVPVLCALLLVPRRTRLIGVSMLIGLSVGSLVGAGICVPLLYEG
jgi:hypothetical protein